MGFSDMYGRGVAMAVAQVGKLGISKFGGMASLLLDYTVYACSCSIASTEDHHWHHLFQ